jgi:hypothetical protein
MIIVILFIALVFMLIATSAHFERQKSIKLQTETNELLRELIAELQANRQAPEAAAAADLFSN